MKKIQLWGPLCLFVVILMNPQTAVISAQRAMRIWYASVAPSLFPFLVLMPLLSSKDACAAYEMMFSGVTRKLLGLPGAAAPAVAVGMIAGSPGSAIVLRRVASNTNMNSEEVRRIALAVTGVSPAYLIIGVGQVMFGSISLGIKLVIVQVCIQLLFLIILPRGQRRDAIEICKHEEAENKNLVLSAAEKMICICGYMVFFSVIAGTLADIVGRKVGGWLLLFMDLPSGIAHLVNTSMWGKKVLIGVAVGFGGLCIAVQNMDIYKEIGLRWREYLKARCLAALLFGSACSMMEIKEGEGMAFLVEFCIKNYAAALLIAGIMALPGLFFLSKKLFLNN